MTNDEKILASGPATAAKVYLPSTHSHIFTKLASPFDDHMSLWRRKAGPRIGVYYNILKVMIHFGYIAYELLQLKLSMRYAVEILFSTDSDSSLNLPFLRWAIPTQAHVSIVCEPTATVINCSIRLGCVLDSLICSHIDRTTDFLST
jgi:hypothetical protein